MPGQEVYLPAEHRAPLPEPRAQRVAALVAVQAAAALAVERAVADAVRSATAVTTPAVALPVWTG